MRMLETSSSFEREPTTSPINHPIPAPFPPRPSFSCNIVTNALTNVRCSLVASSAKISRQRVDNLVRWSKASGEAGTGGGRRCGIRAGRIDSDAMGRARAEGEVYDVERER